MSWQVVRIIRVPEGSPFESFEQARDERDRLQGQDPHSTYSLTHSDNPLDWEAPRGA